MSARLFFKRWSHVTEATALLATVASLEEGLEVLRARARRIAAADGVTIVRRVGDQVAYVGEDAVAPLWTGQSFPIRECVSGLAILARRPIAITDIRVDPRVPQNAYVSTFVRSMAVFPIGAREPEAALGVYWAEPREMDAGAMSMVETLTRSANAALERIAIRREAGEEGRGRAAAPTRARAA
jgi:GAF domain-containing protein